MSVRVMTWNLWWHFGPWAARQPLIVDTIARHAPDILFLQEVWSNERDDQAADLAGALGMSMVRTAPILYDGQSFGNAVLSRWPLERLVDEALPDATGRPGHRRIVAASVDTPWGRWPVASTHLDHRFDRSATREAQLRRVLELSLAWRGDPERDLPVVIGADVNALPDTDEVRMVTGRRDGVDGIVLSDVWEQVGEGDGATWRRDNPYSADTAWPNRRLDYLFVTWPRPKPVGNPLRAWLAGDRAVDTPDGPLWPSDHCAVIADLVTP